MDSIADAVPACAVCSGTSGLELQNVTENFQTRLKDYAKYKNIENLQKQLSQTPPNIKIHRKCQKIIYNELRDKSTDDKQHIVKTKQAKTLTTRSNSISNFDWENLCFLCEEPCMRNIKNPRRSDVHVVETIPFKSKILDICESRGSEDNWAIKVKMNVMNCCDLVAVGGRYHKSCYDKFRKIKNERIMDNTMKQKHFEQLCKYFELECGVTTLKELHDQLKLIAGKENESYSIKHLNRKLKDHYGNLLMANTTKGKTTVLSLKQNVSSLIHEKWYSDRKDDDEDEATRIIKTAAKLILSDIRSTIFNTDVYPDEASLSNIDAVNNWLPSSLLIFLTNLIKDPVKIAGIGHSIVNSTKQSALPPVSFGLSVELDNVFGSKWLINELYSFGFCVSYDELLRYKQCVVNSDTTTDVLSKYMEGSFIQFMGDNVDHNSMTLDGKGAMHSLGSCATTVPYGNQNINSSTLSNPVKRNKRQSISTVMQSKGIPIHQFHTTGNFLKNYVLKPVVHLLSPIVLPLNINYDMIWHASKYTLGNKRPSWNGYMSTFPERERKYPGKATVTFLPIIDLNASDPTALYSLIVFLIRQCDSLSIPTPVITFDQPLWLKAMDIAAEKSLKVVLILGGFHLMMSFLGSIGHLMQNSGLRDALQTMYGRNAVEYILSGKSVSRAIRGHIIIESVLTTKLLDVFLVDDVEQSLRYSKFLSQSSLNPATLPPTERASFFHGCRVHLQVNQWLTLVHSYTSSSHTAA